MASFSAREELASIKTAADDACPVCLCEVQYVLVPCGHSLHLGCVALLCVNSRAMSRPLCRSGWPLSAQDGFMRQCRKQQVSSPRHGFVLVATRPSWEPSLARVSRAFARASERAKKAASSLQRPPTSTPSTAKRHLAERRSSGYVRALRQRAGQGIWPWLAMATQGWCQPRAADPPPPPAKATRLQQPPVRRFKSASSVLHVTLAPALGRAPPLSPKNSRKDAEGGGRSCPPCSL